MGSKSQTRLSTTILFLSHVYNWIKDWQGGGIKIATKGDFKKNKIMPFATIWMQLEIIILSEVNQKEKDKCHLISCMCESGFPWWLKWVKKKICLQCRRLGFDHCFGKIPWRRAWEPTPVFLLGESPWTEEPGRLQSMWSQRVRHDWATKHSTYLNLKYDTNELIYEMETESWT